MATESGLERENLDQGVNRPDFQKDKMEFVFNDATVSPTYHFLGAINEADFSMVPLHHRKGYHLKRHYVNARSVFTKAYLNWKHPGIKIHRLTSSAHKVSEPMN